MERINRILFTIKYYFTHFLIITSSHHASEMMFESFGKTIWYWGTKAIRTGARSPRYTIGLVQMEGMYHLMITTQAEDDKQMKIWDDELNRKWYIKLANGDELAETKIMIDGEEWASTGPVPAGQGTRYANEEDAYWCARAWAEQGPEPEEKWELISE